MAGFIIPNETGSTLENVRQAQPDQKDIEILLMGTITTGVVSGCVVTEQTVPDMTVRVAVGVARWKGLENITVAADTSVTIEAADGTNPRFDYIMIDQTTGNIINPSAGDGKGTASANPVFPAIPADRIIIAVVHVTENETAIENKHIVDKRVLIPTNLPLAIVEKQTETGLGTSTFAGFDFGVLTIEADTDSMVDVANDKMTIKTAGLYQISGHALLEQKTGTVGTAHAIVITYAGKTANTSVSVEGETPPIQTSHDLAFLTDLSVNDDIDIGWFFVQSGVDDKFVRELRLSAVKLAVA